MDGDIGTTTAGLLHDRAAGAPDAPVVGALVFLVGCGRAIGALATTVVAVARAHEPDPIHLEPRVLQRS